MTPEPSRVRPPASSHDSSNAPASGAPRAGQPFARELRTRLSQFPSDLEAQVQSTPYFALGAAFVVGAGAGVLLGSRVLRSVLVSVASSTLVALAARYLRSEP